MSVIGLLGILALAIVILWAIYKIPGGDRPLIYTDKDGYLRSGPTAEEWKEYKRRGGGN